MHLLELEVPPTMLDSEISAIETANRSLFDLASMNLSPITLLATQFIFNLIICSAIIWLFYYPKSHRKEFATTFMLFSAAVFMLLYFMGGVSLDITVGLGLFMIFGIMRYRTEMIPIREMTYLFITIATSVINGINLINDQLLIANLLLVALLVVVEYVVGGRREASKLVCYERIELITPERRAELLAAVTIPIPLPVITLVEEKAIFNWSPMLNSPSFKVALFFKTGCDSPVKELSSIFKLLA